MAWNTSIDVRHKKLPFKGSWVVLRLLLAITVVEFYGSAHALPPANTQAAQKIENPADLKIHSDLAPIEAVSRALDLEIDALESQSQDSIGGREETAAQRFDAAEVLYLLRDYPRAALILMEWIQEPHASRRPEMDKALFLLGDSLFEAKNHALAKETLTRLLRRTEKSGADNKTMGIDRLAALRRLIQIADIDKDWQSVDALIASVQAQNNGQLPSELAYQYGKSLLLRGQADRVDAMVDGVAVQDPFYGRCLYLAAAAQFQRGNLPVAIKMFGQFKDLSDTDLGEHAVAIREFAALNRGRILLSLGRIFEATAAYGEVPQTSPRFEDALYEIAWSYVRAGESASDPWVAHAEYQKAINALEIFILGSEDSAIVPDAELLLANVLMRNDRTEESHAAFSQIVARYTAVETGLKDWAQEEISLNELYRQVAQRAAAKKKLMPKIAVSWAQSEKSLRKALGVVADLKSARMWVDSSQKIATRLASVLHDIPKDFYLPDHQKSQADARAVMFELLSAVEDLMRLQRNFLKEILNDKQRKTLEVITQDRSAWLAKTVASQASNDLQKMGDAFWQKVVQEQEIIAQVKPDLSDTGRRRRLGVAEMHKRLKSLRDRLHALSKKSSSQHAQKIALIRKRLLQEEKALASYGETLVQTENEAKSVVGFVVRDAISSVRRRLQSVVVRGDLGMVDVVWRNKERSTEEIQRFSAAKKSEMSAIRAEYDGLRAD